VRLLLLLFSVSVYASDSQQNGDLNNNTQDSTVNSNNVTTSTTTQNVGAGAGKPNPVNTAISPSLMSSGQDTCLRSASAGMQIDVLGINGGRYVQDEECNRRKDSKVLKDMGMSIAAVSRMCQNNNNWTAMFIAGTPCPILVNGRMVFGKNAFIAMKNNPTLFIPDYEDKETHYNQLLGIGVTIDEEDTSDNLSVSERFRPQH
jgi:hypothetical protein